MMCRPDDYPPYEEEPVLPESVVIAKVIEATATEEEKKEAMKRPMTDLEREDLMAAIEFDLL